MPFISAKDPSFPESLQGIKPAVNKLYYKNNLDKKLFEKCIAVVGSRAMTTYGQQVIDKIIPSLTAAGATIVSGFMYGVDQAAHKAAIESGGKTIAVLGWGIDHVVDEADKQVYNDILNSGMILSEYEADTKPQLWMFPKRNRIVAGLSQAVLVIEAAEKSGSLITADLATRFNRKLFAVPGKITSSVSRGTNHLIATKQAKLVSTADDILEELNWEININSQNNNDSNNSNNKIINLLSNEELTADEIARKLKKSVAETGKELSLLQLQGAVTETNGKYYKA